jgi:peptidoglycan hydrolase CwlO-like protein
MKSIKECFKTIWKKITIILLAWCLILTISFIVFVAFTNDNVTNIMKNINNLEYDFEYQIDDIKNILDNIEYETNDIEYRIDNIDDKLDDIEYKIDDIEYNIRYR